MSRSKFVNLDSTLFEDLSLITKERLLCMYKQYLDGASRAECVPLLGKQELQPRRYYGTGQR